jgi:hypothetical protein
LTAGLAPAYANSLLDTLSGTNVTAPTGCFAELHVGDPGIAGTSNPSSVTTRQSVSWNAASGGAKTMSNTPSWGTWAGTSPETITHLAFWSASSGGTFLFSLALAAAVTVQTGDPLQMPSLTAQFTAVAA